ncbi:MAG TPA: glycosyltransferase family 2 protein [Acidobacteriota bacterium]|nr:glycosyltransferase family 2 protein [Acidobacteriota bacterium]
MNGNLLNISVIIPTRNRVNSLIETLTSIGRGAFLPREIIIVDQSDVPLDKSELRAAVDGTVSLKVLYLEAPSSSQARNEGAAAATGDILLFMDDDVLLDARSLSELARVFEDEQIAFVDAMHTGKAPPQGRYPDILGVLFMRKKLLRKGGYVCKGAMVGRYPDRVHDIVDTEWGMGFFFAVRKRLFDRYGIRFDENLRSYAYAEDLDFTYSFCKKAVSQGHRAVLDPRIYVHHVGSQEWRLPNRKATYVYVIHRLYLSYKHFQNPWYRLLLVWSDLGEILRRILAKQDYSSVIKAYSLALRYARRFKKGQFPSDLFRYTA